MIKKGLNIFLLFLASFVLLAHAVIPHHHHNHEICLVNVHAETNKTDHGHLGCNTDHQSSDDADCDLSCILEKVVIFRTGQSNQYNKTAVSPNDGKPVFFASIIESGGSAEYYPEIIKSPPTYFIPSHLKIAQQTVGLRAPPIV